MQKITILLVVLFIGWFQSSNAQLNTKIGVGYFGNMITYPGLVLEYELEQQHSQWASTPFRINLGFYHHPRYQDGIFADINYGFRRYYKSNLFLEEGIGIGLLQSRLNSDGVYKVDDFGNITESSRWNTMDFMPSLTLGIGYRWTNPSGKKITIWIREKIFWQYPHKNTSVYSPVTQVGVSF
jgi:hypothetical protein